MRGTDEKAVKEFKAWVEDHKPKGFSDNPFCGDSIPAYLKRDHRHWIACLLHKMSGNSRELVLKESTV
jgi:hypothetical protein